MRGTQFTCFTCFTGTKVGQRLQLTRSIQRDSCRRWRYSIYLLYWYKSTNTDAEGAQAFCEEQRLEAALRVRVYVYYFLYYWLYYTLYYGLYYIY